MSSKKSRSPLDRNPPLRAAGQSLTDEIDRVVEDQAMAPALFALMMILVAAMEWTRHFTTFRPAPEMFSIVAALTSAYAAFKFIRTKERVKQLRLGRDGERAVAEHLEWLRRLDFVVFHDVPSGDANIDHVVMGSRGVFTIETKTYSKPLRGACRVTVVRGEVFANGHRIDRNPMVQAKAQARWLGNFLRESKFQPYVWPVVVFPGWFVEAFDSNAEEIWVLETKALSKFIENAPVRHTSDEVKAMASALCSHVRAQSSR